MRRYLHYSPAEWDALPWWQSRMYLDELKRDLAPHEKSAADDPGQSEDDKARDMGFRIE